MSWSSYSSQFRNARKKRLEETSTLAFHGNYLICFASFKWLNRILYTHFTEHRREQCTLNDPLRLLTLFFTIKISNSFRLCAVIYAANSDATRCRRLEIGRKDQGLPLKDVLNLLDSVFHWLIADKQNIEELCDGILADWQNFFQA